MARRNDVLDSYASVWFCPFGYWCESDEVPEIAKLQAIGVREAEFHVGRAEEGLFFTNVTSAVAEKGREVDVAWVMQVRQMCEEAGPSLFSKMMSVAGPDDEGQGPDYRDLVAEGELLLFVRLWILRKTLHASVQVALPESHLTRVESVV